MQGALSITCSSGWPLVVARLDCARLAGAELALLLGLGCVSEPVHDWVADDDSRRVVSVSAKQRAVVKQVMRGNLETVQAVLTAAGTSDLKAVHRLARTAAQAPGPGTVEPTLKPLLPDEWRMMGKQVHRDWKALAKLTKEDASAAAVSAAVANVTATCVTCHTQYRLETH